MIVLHLYRICIWLCFRDSSCFGQGMPWQIASHSQQFLVNFRRRPVATTSPLWTQLASPGNVGRGQIQEVEHKGSKKIRYWVFMSFLLNVSWVFHFHLFQCCCVYLFRVFNHRRFDPLHVLNTASSDDICKCGITCAGGNGPAHVSSTGF